MSKHFLWALACCLFMVGCSDDDLPAGAYDPSQPVVFTDFTPKTGALRTRLYIQGSNFGTDVSKIHVSVGGVDAKVIGSNGTEIYCMVRSRSYESTNEITIDGKEYYPGTIKVTIDGADGQPAAEYSFENPFGYEAKQVVGTLIRNVDEDGVAGWTFGPFETASVPSNDWMMFDPKYDGTGDRLLFSSNWDNGFWSFNLTTEEVTRLFPKQGYDSSQSFTFSADGDTLLWFDDNGVTDAYDREPNIHYALRRENFRKLRAYNYGHCTYGGVYMSNGDVFYSSWVNGGIYKMHRKGTIPNIDDQREVCFYLAGQTQIDGAHTKMELHPSEKYVYMHCSQRGVIMRADYNEADGLLHYTRVVAGSFSEKGCTEGVGNVARFGEPWAGIFVHNPDYVGTRPDGDEYDYYFMDNSNHCIWKLTPDGIASIVAGRSNYTADQKYDGYIDGDPLLEARFKNPKGLAYDELNETWYIGDNGNSALRYMRVE